MMKKTLILLFLCLVMAVHGQNLNVQSTYDNVPASISLTELSKMQYRQDDGPKAIIELINGASYTLDVKEITSTSIDAREDILTTGEYAGMRRLKNFSSIDELNVGDIIGIIDTLDYSAEGYINTVYGDLFGLEKILVPALKVNVNALATANLMTGKNIRIHVVDLVYVSTDTRGVKFPMSERIIYPYSTGNKQLRVHDILIDNHFTVTAESESPSKYYWSTLLNGMVTKGYLFVSPDGMMFGAVLIHRIIRQGVIIPNGKGGYKLNPNNEHAAALIRFAKRNNLCDSGLWVPQSDISITHDTKDELVPYDNTQEFYNNMYAKMNRNGHSLEVKTVEASGLLHFYFCMAWATSALTGLPINTIINQMKSASSA